MRATARSLWAQNTRALLERAPLSMLIPTYLAGPATRRFFSYWRYGVEVLSGIEQDNQNPRHQSLMK
jgi:hypothetical protein